jgi:hypothetical protein
MTITCQDDGETQVKYNLNLTEVKVQKPEGHNNKIMLSDEMGIMMKYPAFDDFVRSSIIGSAPSADGVIEIVAGCIDQIFDKEDVYDSSTTSKKEFVEFLEGLTNNQFEEIQKFFETAPKLEHTIKIKNPKTGVENDIVISGLANFFG